MGADSKTKTQVSVCNIASHVLSRVTWGLSHVNQPQLTPSEKYLGWADSLLNRTIYKMFQENVWDYNGKAFVKIFPSLVNRGRAERRRIGLKL